MTVILGSASGMLLGAALGALGLTLTRGWGAWLRLFLGLAPLVAVLLILDAVTGTIWAGAYVAGRIVVLATVGQVFARSTQPEGLVAGMRALHVPYTVTFVLVAGARFIPNTLADLVDLRDAARLRGVIIEGSLLAQVRGWSILLVPLIVGTIRRGLQLGEAMEARGFGASAKRTTRQQLAWRPSDSCVVLLALTILVAFLTWRP